MKDKVSLVHGSMAITQETVTAKMPLFYFHCIYVLIYVNKT